MVGMMMSGGDNRHPRHDTSSTSRTKRRGGGCGGEFVTFTFIVSATEQQRLQLPVAALIQREEEMIKTAEKLGVTKDKWHGSFLYRQFYQSNNNGNSKNVMVNKKINKKINNNRKKNGDITASFSTSSSSSSSPDPQQQHRQYEFDCRGKSWLTQHDGETIMDWLERYYQTGLLQIPSSAHGYGVLAALEYFAILYAPDQCHFADYHVYERVQLWARYLSHRDALTAWVVKHASVVALLATSSERGHGGRGETTTTTTTPSTTVHFGVAPSSSSHADSAVAMDLGTRRILALGGTEYAIIAHQLFAPRPDDDDLDDTIRELRQDFSQHVTCELESLTTTIMMMNGDHKKNAPEEDAETTTPRCKAAFTIKPVTLHSPIKVVNRAVLGIAIRRPDRQQDRQQQQLLLQINNKNQSPTGLRKKKTKLVFTLPEELDLPTGRLQHIQSGPAHQSNTQQHPFLGRTTAMDENTVTSGLTGPFYTDTTGHVKDVFEHEEAKRHEWVQTALMNRGITERMERLLHPEDHPAQQQQQSSKAAANNSTNNPWDWFTGLGVCEMSRTVVERVGGYMQQPQQQQQRDVPQRRDKNSMVTCTTGTTTVRDQPGVVVKKSPSSSSPSSRGGSPVGKRTSSRVKDRLKELVIAELDHRLKAESNNCDSTSKESPRGVADFYPPEQQQIPQRQQPTRIPAVIEESTMMTAKTRQHPPGKVEAAPRFVAAPNGNTNNNTNITKKKGILGMFRRRKQEEAYLPT